jgi:WD40 repeat protein
VSSASFSPDGKSIITASDDRTARIWDVATGKEIAVLHGHEDIVRSVVFSPDSNHIVTASSDGIARIWQASITKEICSDLGYGNRQGDRWPRGREGRVSSAAFSPEGNYIVTTSLLTAQIWDVRTAVIRPHELVVKICRRTLPG